MNAPNQLSLRHLAPWPVLLRYLFVLLLGVSGGAKMLDLPGFFVVVETYQLLPTSLILSVAFSLAAFEIALAIGLAVCKQRVLRTRCAALVLALHAGYFAWLAIAYSRGLVIPNCGCFGVYWPRPLTAMRLVEDAILVILAFCLYANSAKKSA